MIMGLIQRFFQIIVLIGGVIIAFIAIGWFIDNAAFAGQWVGSLFTAIKTFFTSAMSASPLG